MTPDPKPVPYARLRAANIALQLFHGGKDTSDIAKSLNVSESEVVELIRSARGKKPDE
jgi:DNA-binding transcriptional regulator LsrR (DeoR family)